MRKKERKEERRKQRYIKKRAEDEQNKHKPSILKLYKLYLGFLPGWCFLLFLGHLKWISVLMLYAPVFIFTSGSSAHVVIYRSDCRYLPHSIHFSEFMPIYFTRKWTKHENTRSPPFSYDTEIAWLGAPQEAQARGCHIRVRMRLRWYQIRTRNSGE